MAGVSLSAIRKAYGHVPVLKDVSLDIADGEFLTLLGPSGCGKSTLLRIIAGLEQQDSGAVSIGESTVDHLRPRYRDVAMVFQSYALYPHMTVEQNMATPLRMRRMRPWQRLPLIGRFMPGARALATSIGQDVRAVARALEIEHLLDRKPSQLSGGQRQRVAVGRAMVRQPAAFLMDEPLSNLDAKLRVQMRAEIKDLHRKLGVTFIYVTHDQAEAMTMSDRVALMLDGRILQIAPPSEIYENPQTRYVAEFVGTPKINILEGNVREGGIIEAAGMRLPVSSPLEAGSAASIGFRPEALRVALDKIGTGLISGNVRLVEHMGSDLFLHVEVPEAQAPVIARVTPQSGAQIRAGQPIRLEVDPGHLLVFDGNGDRVAVHAGQTLKNGTQH